MRCVVMFEQHLNLLCCLNTNYFNICFDFNNSRMTKLQSKQNKLTSRRAVAPVIATLLLVAIAVVGGSIVFVFSQGFFSSAQVSGSPNIESLKIVGYDATDGPILQIHDGISSGVDQGDLANDGLVTGDRIAVYLQNQSVQKVTLSEIRLAGTVYSFVSSASGTIDEYDAAAGTGVLAGQTSPSYMIATDSNDDGAGMVTAATVLTTTSAEIQPGQQATVIIQLDENVKTGRDTQFKLTTTNGAVFVGTVIAGQQSG
jgi:flagellin-like protein